MIFLYIYYLFTFLYLLYNQYYIIILLFIIYIELTQNGCFGACVVTTQRVVATDMHMQVVTRYFFVFVFKKIFQDVQQKRCCLIVFIWIEVKDNRLYDYFILLYLSRIVILRPRNMYLFLSMKYHENGVLSRPPYITSDCDTFKSTQHLVTTSFQHFVASSAIVRC